MKAIVATLFAPVLLAMLVSSPLFGADYRYSRIDVPNGTETTIQGINARGDMVGRYIDANGAGQSFLFRNGAYTNITFPGASVTNVKAINARGDIVGVFADASGSHGFLLRDGQFKQIDYPGASATLVRGINNAGDVTGNYTDATGNQKGFVLKEGVFRNVHVPSSASTDVFEAQDNGLVMVGDVVLQAGLSIHGFVRTSPGNFKIIDYPGTAVPCTRARWINERGDIVGAFANVDTIDDCSNAPPTHGFLLHDGKYRAIDFPGSPNTFVEAINDDGTIVGIFFDKKGNLHGFKAVPQK
jgi:uncharacterized membrane protein